MLPKLIENVLEEVPRHPRLSAERPFDLERFVVPSSDGDEAKCVEGIVEQIEFERVKLHVYICKK